MPSSERMVKKQIKFSQIAIEELRHLINGHGEAYTLIDVRTPNECAPDQPLTKLPTAHNIPFNEFSAAFQLSDTDFEQKYGFEKPKPSSLVIVYCQHGARSSLTASYLVQQCNYTRVFHFRGGAAQWYSSPDFFYRMTMQ